MTTWSQGYFRDRPEPARIRRHRACRGQGARESEEEAGTKVLKPIDSIENRVVKFDRSDPESNSSPPSQPVLRWMSAGAWCSLPKKVTFATHFQQS
jgi:hypothetical protein